MLGERMEAGSDFVLRALTNDGGFRVITACTTGMVRAAVRAQGARGGNAKHFAELLTGAVIVRETMAPTLRVQAVLRGAGGRGSLVADSFPGGLTRGLVNTPPGGALIRADNGAQLQISRAFPHGGLHQGVVSIPHRGGISGGLMGYMQQSEQVLSLIAVGCNMSGDEIVVSGGYIVQVLPEVVGAALEAVTSRLERVEPIDVLLASTAGNPEALLEQLLGAFGHTKLDRTPIHFGCTCDQLRVVSALATIGTQELQTIIRDRRVLDIQCDYCGAEYQVGPEQLRPLLERS